MEMTQATLDQLNDNPVYKTLGIRVEEAGGGTANSRLTSLPNMCWPFPGQPHGGVIFTLMDVTMAWAVFAPLEPGHNCATINLDIQYTRPAKGNYFTCVAKTTHKTGRLTFVRAEILDEKEELVAMGQGTYRVVEADIMKK